MSSGRWQIRLGAGLLAGIFWVCPGLEASPELLKTWVSQRFLESEEVLLRSAASPDGKLLAIHQKSGGIRIVDLVKKQTLRTLPKLDDRIQCMCLASGSGPLLVGAGKRLYLLDINGKDSPKVVYTTGAVIYRVSADPALKLAALGTPEGLRVINYESGDQVFSSLDNPCLDVVFSPDGATLAASQGKNITLYDLPNVVQRWKGSASFFPAALSFSQDGTLLGAAGDSNQVIFFKSKDGSSAHKVSLGFSASKIQYLSVSPDGKGFVAGSDRRVYIVDDLAKGDKREIKLEDRITSLVLSSGAQSLLASSEDTRYLHVWPTTLKLPEGLFVDFKPKIQIRIVQPRVQIVSPTSDTLVKGESVEVLAKIKTDPEQKLEKLELKLNGQRIDVKGSILDRAQLPAGVTLEKDEELHRFLVAIPNQDCILALQGETQYAASQLAVLRLRREASPSLTLQPKPQIKIVPPQVAILSPVAETLVQGEAVQMVVKVKSAPDQKHQAVQILVDGRPVEVLGGVRPKNMASSLGVPELAADEELLLFSVPVPNRDCTVAVFAETQYANSEPVSVRLRREPPPPVKPPPPRVIHIIRPEVAILTPRDEEFAGSDVVNLSVRLVHSGEQKVSQLKVQVDGQTVAGMGESVISTKPVMAAAGAGQAASTTPNAPVAMMEEIRQISVPIPSRHCTISLWAETEYANSDIARLKVRREDKVLAPPPQTKPQMISIIPPTVAIVSHEGEAEVKGESLALSVKVGYSQLQKVTGIRILIDGVPVPQSALRAVRPRMDTEGTTPVATKPSATSPGSASVKPGLASLIEEIQNFTIPVPPKDCTVAVIAETMLANSELATLKVRYKEVKKLDPTSLPRLYVLAVGVANYSDKTLNLTYPAKDAKDFSGVLEHQKNRLYREITIRLLTDEQATRDNIMDGLEWLQKQVTQKDIAVVFFAGHGMNDPMTGQFYFLPHNANLTAVKRTMVANTDITSTMEYLPGKRVLFMDSCNSANVSGKTKTRSALDIASLRKEFESAGQGAVVFAAASGRQGAQEKEDWGNGAFTKAVIEGLTGKADPKKTGRVTVSSLNAYITERVKEITEGFQTPIFKSQDDLADFPLVILESPEP